MWPRLLLLVAAGCGAASPTPPTPPTPPAPREAPPDNSRSEADALASWRAAHAGVTDLDVGALQVEPAGLELTRAPAQGLVGDEWLARDPHTGHVVFARQECLEPQPCACDLQQHYRLFTESPGHIAIVRLHPHKTVKRVHVASCSGGCGVPLPPPKTSRMVLDLGAVELSTIAISDVLFEYVKIEQQCDRIVPAA